MWIKLSALHKRTSESNKLLVMTHFHEYEITSEDKVALHVTKIEKMACQLRDVGKTLSDVTIIAKILGNLPEKCNTLHGTV